MTHVMVDLETLDTRETAVIVSVGAVAFDPESDTLGKEFYRVADIASCPELTIGADTVRWWINQPHEVSDVLKLPGETLHSILIDFAEFLCGCPYIHIDEETRGKVILWGNGSTFDNMILRNAYKACYLNYPVIYKHDLCYRTIRKLYDLPKDESGLQHNALEDARRQAKTLCSFMHIRGLK